MGITIRTLTIIRTRFTDVADGDYVNPEVDEEVFPQFDFVAEEGEETWVDCLVAFLKDSGLTQGSSSQFHPGLWYCNPDGSTIVNYRTREREEVTGHLKGLTEAEEKQIWEWVTGVRV